MMVQEEDEDNAPLTSHEKRAKESAAHAKINQQMTQKEKDIKEDEHHKRQLNRLLLNKLADNIKDSQIVHEEMSNRLFGTIPDRIAPFKDLTKATEIKVVQDNTE